jgi:hypothetical protein
VLALTSIRQFIFLQVFDMIHDIPGVLMVKKRKMLGNVNAESTVALKELIDTQSKDTIRKWCLDYAENKILPIF